MDAVNHDDDKADRSLLHKAAVDMGMCRRDASAAVSSSGCAPIDQVPDRSAAPAAGHPDSPPAPEGGRWRSAGVAKAQTGVATTLLLIL